MDNADALSQLDTRNIAGVKLFMGASTGNMLVDDAEALRRVFANSPTILVTHCEDTPTISANMKAYKEKFGADPDVSYHPLIRSEAACVESTRLAVQLGQRIWDAAARSAFVDGRRIGVLCPIRPADYCGGLPPALAFLRRRL